jgi:hypothetical protein
MMGENMKKESNHVELKVLYKNCIFHVVVFLLVYTAFFTQILKLNIKI